MPMSKTKLKNAAIAAKSAALPKIHKELLDQFVSGPMTGDAVNAASMAFRKALIERALGSELGHHLGSGWKVKRPRCPMKNRRRLMRVWTNWLLNSTPSTGTSPTDTCGTRSSGYRRCQPAPSKNCWRIVGYRRSPRTD